MRYMRYLILTILLASLLTGCVVVIKTNIGRDIQVNKDYKDAALAVKQDYKIKGKR